MHEDGSGLDCTVLGYKDGQMVVIEECECPSSDLIIAPEDKLVKRYNSEDEI